MIFLLKYWRYVAGIGVIAALLMGYFYWHHLVYTQGAQSVQVKWDKQKAIDAAAVTAELARQAAVKAQTDEHNAQVMNDLNDAKAQAAGLQHDLDMARRLLAAAARSSQGSAVPEAVSQPPATAPSAPGSDAGARSLLGLVTDAIGECRRQADEWDALQAELEPQL